MAAAPGDEGGEPTQLTPPGFGVGSRVYGHGGGEVVPLADGSVVVVADHDQRWWRLPVNGGEPVPLSVDGGDKVRYADGYVAPDGWWLYCIRERPAEPEPAHEIVRLDLRSATPQDVVVVTGHDFVAAPRVSPDGRRLAWLSWEHPDLPWDSSTLWVASLNEQGGVVDPTRVVAAANRAVLQPQWLAAWMLGYLDDASGWWNPAYVTWPAGDTTRIALWGEECAEPPWSLGCRGYGVLNGGELLCIATRHARSRLVIAAPPDRELVELGLPFTYYSRSSLTIRGDDVLTVAYGPQEPGAVVHIRVERDERGAARSARVTRVRGSDETALDAAFRPKPRVLNVPAEDGRNIEMIYYPPAHQSLMGLPGERAPLVVDIHGGPTSRVPLAYSSETVFWTSRGFAVLYPNYAGSSGAGRRQRERLRGQWGVVDVADCEAAIDAVCSRGWADAKRVVCRGASAGGYTALRLAETTSWPRAVSSWYGVTDPAALVRQTHKLESRYVDQLLGHSQDRTVKSPRCPVLLLQGEQDPVVPPAQAEALRRRLSVSNSRLAMVRFPAERHGFEHPDVITHAMAVEVAFFREILGLRGHDEPVGAIPWVDSV